MLLLFCKEVYAQNGNVILFTENGEKFTAILNGLRQNETPQTNVKITGLNANWYKLKIIFQDTKLGEKAFNLGCEPGNESTFVVKKNSKGEYILRPISQVPIAEAPPTPKEQTVVVYNAGTEPAGETQTVTHQTTTTTHSTGTSENVNVSMGINMGSDGGNVNMNMSGMDPNATTHTTTTTTTTVTHTSTSTMDPPVSPPPVYLLGYTGAIGCPVPMSPSEFEDFKSTVSSKSFEDTKLTIAKQVTGNGCLLASQVREVMRLFDFEATKLTYAKFAYNHTYDIGNYYKVNDAFDFESSVDDLNKSIGKH